MEAYTVSGSRIGLPGIVPFATIPRRWTVLQCKETTGWFKVIKDVQPGESPKMGINFEMMETCLGMLLLTSNYSIFQVDIH